MLEKIRNEDYSCFCLGIRTMKNYHIWSLIKVPFARYLFPQNCLCPICNKRSVFFLPSRGVRAELLIELGGVGGNPDAFQCCWCGSTDRERHLWMYLESTGLLKDLQKSKILHFAPEKRLAKKISDLSPKEYIFADLYPVNENILPVDIQATGYKADSFDIVIANHVLEHVENDMTALHEVFRILKPGGFAILQTPYCELLQTTWSDPGVTSNRAREIAYGQEDHARLFGADIFSRFLESGLVSEVRRHNTELENNSPDEFGVNEREPFFLFKKPEGI